MQRVLVIGCSGAGKSRFALRLAALTRLPVIHLDAHFWRAGWVETPTDEWQAKIAELVASPAWIMDGNYGGSLVQRLVRADTVIFLDCPTWLCLWRVLKRALLNWGRTRPDMAAGCREQLDLGFLRYVLGYRRRHRPRVLERLKGFDGTIVTLATPRDAEEYLSKLVPVR